MSAPTNGSPLQLLIAVYGSDKKYVQNFEPFKAHCEHIASASTHHGEGRVRLPVHRVVVVQVAGGESPDNSNSGSSFHVLVQPAPTRVEDIDVLFLKMSTEPVEARLALRRWVEEVQAKQLASKRRPMVLVDALDVSDSVKSRIGLCTSLGNDAFLKSCRLEMPLSFAVHRAIAEDGSATTASIEHLCGVAVGGESRGGLRPFVVKSDASNGPKFTHGMYVMAGTPVFTPEMTSLHPSANAWTQAAATYLTECPTTQSLLVQEVIPSAAVVYKVYVLGPNYVFVKRLNNDAFLKSSAGVCDEAGERVWAFNSQDRTLFPPKSEEGEQGTSDDVVWEQHILDASLPSIDDGKAAEADASPNATMRREIMSLLAAVVPYLQKPSVLGFGLFGMDLVTLPVEQPLPPTAPKEGSSPSATTSSANPQRHRTTFALLDINYFPSFKGVPHAQEKLLQYIEHCVMSSSDSS